LEPLRAFFPKSSASFVTMSVKQLAVMREKFNIRLLIGLAVFVGVAYALAVNFGISSSCYNGIYGDEDRVTYMKPVY
jgi:hypothetical protein